MTCTGFVNPIAFLHSTKHCSADTTKPSAAASPTNSHLTMPCISSSLSSCDHFQMAARQTEKGLDLDFLEVMIGAQML